MRDFFKHMLSLTPASDDSWHCPWFKIIQGYAANGVLFGLLAYVIYHQYLGLVAVAVGLSVSMFTIGSRSRGSSSC